LSKFKVIIASISTVVILTGVGIGLWLGGVFDREETPPNPQLVAFTNALNEFEMLLDEFDGYIYLGNDEYIFTWRGLVMDTENENRQDEVFNALVALNNLYLAIPSSVNIPTEKSDRMTLFLGFDGTWMLQRLLTQFVVGTTATLPASTGWNSFATILRLVIISQVNAYQNTGSGFTMTQAQINIVYNYWNTTLTQEQRDRFLKFPQWESRIAHIATAQEIYNSLNA